MFSLFKCFCPVIEDVEQEPYERRMLQLYDIRDFIEEGRLREAAMIVRDLKYDLEVNKETKCLVNVDLVARLDAEQVLVDPDTHDYMWGLNDALLDLDANQSTYMCQLLITQFDFSPDERLGRALDCSNIKLLNSTLTNRRSIKIIKCDLTKKANFLKLLATIKRNPGLKRLEINFCKMSNTQARKVLEVLSEMRHVYCIDFKGNRLTTEIIEEITDMLEDIFLFPSLWWISLENNENINILPGKLLRLFALRWRKNPVVEETPPSLMPSIQSVTENVKTFREAQSSSSPL